MSFWWKTVCKRIESIPRPSTLVPWLRKQQNCPSGSVTELGSAFLVPTILRALRILVSLKRRQTDPLFTGSHSASRLSFQSGIRRIFCAFKLGLLFPCLEGRMHFCPASLPHPGSIAPLLFPSCYGLRCFSLRASQVPSHICHSSHPLSFISSVSINDSGLGPGSRYKTKQNKRGPCLLGHMEEFGF